MFGKKDDEPKRTAFEYKVKFFHKPDHWQEPNDGWEMVTANEHIDGRGISVATTFYFKRKLRDPSTN